MKPIRTILSRLTQLLAGCVYGHKADPIPEDTRAEDDGPCDPWERLIRGDELRKFIPPGVIQVEWPILKVSDPVPRTVPLLSQEYKIAEGVTLISLIRRLQIAYEYPGRSLYVYSVRAHKLNGKTSEARYLIRCGTYASPE